MPEDNQQPQGEQMTLEAFRQAKQSGTDLYQQVETDAASQDNAYEGDYTQADTQEPTDTQEVTESATDGPADFDAEDHVEVPENQKTAFQKALEREKRKAREAAEAELKTQFETQYNPYKAFFDQLGMDPQTALKAMEENKIKQEAENLAYQNGWDEQQTQWYVQQQKQEKEMHDLRVSVQINDLADTADYPGIKQMKGPISDFIRSNPRATVDQAYWAVGGQSLAQQLKREAEQREIAKRSKPRMTNVPAEPMDTKGPEPLPQEAISFMRRTGMSEAQVRMMLKDEGPKTLTEYRQMKNKKG